MTTLKCSFRVFSSKLEQLRDIGGSIQHAHNLYEVGGEKYIVVRR